MLEILLASILIMIASLSGAFTAWKKFGKIIEKHLSFLVSFSAGVFLVIAYQLSREVFHKSPTIEYGLLWIVLGAFLIWALFKFIPGFHHHHHDEKGEDHSHSYIDARRILFSDAIHNVGDGVLLVAAFSVSTTLGIVTALSVFVHELIQEVSEFFVLRQAGFSVKKALITNFLISSTILIGSLGGYFLIELFKVLEVPLLGIAAGSFLIVVIYDLIPHSIRESSIKVDHLKHILWFFIGLLIMTGVNLATVHTHELEEDSHSHEDEHTHAIEEDHHEDEIHHDEDKHGPEDHHE